jgi:hypothetical protein
VYPEESEKCEQNPRYRVVEMTTAVPEIGVAVHGRNEKKIDDPADQEEPKSKEPDGSRNGLAVVKPMGARETEDP